MATEHAKNLSKITAEIHVAFLKPLGFKKRGNTFNRTSPDGLVEVVNFQAGRYEPFAIEAPGFYNSNTLYGYFTVNLGIIVPEYVLGKTDKSFFQEYECAIRIRIGELANAKEDLWFKIENPEVISKTIVELLQKYGVPFLEKFNTREKIISNIPEKSENVLSSPSLILLAKIHHQAGRKEKARELLKKQYEETAANEGHKSYVKSLAETLGIPIK